MKSKNILLILTLICFFTNCVKVDGLYIELINREKDNRIFIPENTIVYSYSILKNDTAYKCEITNDNFYKINSSKALPEREYFKTNWRLSKSENNEKVIDKIVYQTVKKSFF